MVAVWGMDYDYRTDKCYDRPMCPECNAPVIRFKDGKYKCVSCRQPVEVIDAEMLKWLAKREEEKIEYEDCPQWRHDGYVYGCGGKGTVETHYVRNNVTLEWQTAWGECSKCGMRFIV